MKTYYHFTSDKLSNGEPIPPIGEWLHFTGKLEMCNAGLHASEHPFDALQYAPGPMLHRVELSGAIINGDDKVVSERRKIVATIDATDLLRNFARKQALSVIHLWEAPQVVKDYLTTGDESLRDAARAAAWTAAWDAARGAVEAAARAAAWAAARKMFAEMVGETFVANE